MAAAATLPCSRSRSTSSIREAMSATTTTTNGGMLHGQVWLPLAPVRPPSPVQRRRRSSRLPSRCLPAAAPTAPGAVDAAAILQGVAAHPHPAVAPLPPDPGPAQQPRVEAAAAHAPSTGLGGDQQQQTGVTIRVGHPTAINTSRERHWALLRELVPPDEWQNTAVVLACLESIYRAEYQQFGQAAVAALQAANALAVPPEPEPLPASARTARSRSRSRSRSASPPPAASQSGDESGGAAARASSPPSPEAGPAGLLQTPGPELPEDIAARADGQLAALLALLTRRSQFQPLTAWDVEISKALNRDYLFQLFIVGDTRRMDPGLVTHLKAAGVYGGPATLAAALLTTASERADLTGSMAGGSPSSPGSFDWAQPLASDTASRSGGSNGDTPAPAAASHIHPSLNLDSPAAAPAAPTVTPATVALASASGDEEEQERQRRAFQAALAAECDALLLLKRNWSHEGTTGRLIVQKLDYLQTLVVAQTLEAARRVVEGVSSPPGGLRQPAPGCVSAESFVMVSVVVPGAAVFVHRDAARSAAESVRWALHQAAAASTGSDWSDMSGSESDSDPAAAHPQHQRPRKRRGSPGAGQWGRRLRAAARVWARWFSERGVGPRLDVMTLQDIDALLPLPQTAQEQPLRLHKVALAEILGTHPLQRGVGELLSTLFRPVELQQPSIKELVVAYRRLPDYATGTGGGSRLLATARKVARRLRLVRPPAPHAAPAPRPPITIRIYRDIPLPTWQLALPDKLLQFRPLDLLRADLFALTGLVALLAQAKYESLVLDVITLVSAAVFLVRIALGFKRMDDRYRNQVAEVLREKTVASDAPALEYLAAAAGLQQFKQSSLAYIYALQRQHKVHHHDGVASNGYADRASLDGGFLVSNAAAVLQVSSQGPAEAAAITATTTTSTANGTASDAQPPSPQHSLAPAPVPAISADDLGAAVQQLLWEKCQQQVLFDSEQAIAELVRLGLAEAAPAKGTAEHSSNGTDTPPASPAGDLLYRVVDRRRAMRLVQQHWDGLLWQRVDGILREFR